MTKKIRSCLEAASGAVTAAVAASDAGAYLLPGKCLPRCKTVIIAAVPYYCGEQAGTISLYARGRDYHLVLRELFAEAVTAAGGGRLLLRSYADASPFQEVALASAAGLGEIGQNGLLLTRRYGSYVFLGEVCGDFDGETSPLRAPRPCIGCGACRTACPVESGCLSEITQRKGELSEEEKALMRRYETAWGCDICQKACPANRAAEQTKLPAFREELVCDFDYETLKHLSNGTVERYYAGRAFLWRGGGIVKRNAEIIGNAEASDKSQS